MPPEKSCLLKEGSSSSQADQSLGQRGAGLAGKRLSFRRLATSMVFLETPSSDLKKLDGI